MVVHNCNPRHRNPRHRQAGGLWSEASPGQKCETAQKITKAEKG
jgi:hypothetical protein